MSARLSRVGRAVALLAIAMMLGGCLGSTIGNRQAPRIYDLGDIELAPVSPTRPAQLLVSEPRSSKTLDSARMAVRPEPNEFQYYAGAAWRDRAPQMMQRAIIDGFEDAAAFAAVGEVGGGLRADLMLTLDLRRFEAVYRDGVPHAVIELQATLLDGAAGNAIGSTRLRAEQPAADTEVPAVAGAFGAAADELLQQLVVWSHRIAGERPAG